MIKTIGTTYNGYRYRSRLEARWLEARWAVFFDHLEIKFDYEPQGYVIGGIPYLPDFKLTFPSGQLIFAEVKDSGVDDHEGEPVRLCRGLATMTDTPVLFLNGLPAYRVYHLFLPTLSPTSFCAVFFRGSPVYLADVDEYWFQHLELDEMMGRLNFPFNDRRARKALGANLVEAVNASRGARFEHGESGIAWSGVR